MLRLTLLAPEIVEAILDGRQPAELQLDDLLEGFRWSGRAARTGGRFLCGLIFESALQLFPRSRQAREIEAARRLPAHASLRRTGIFTARAFGGAKSDSATIMRTIEPLTAANV